MGRYVLVYPATWWARCIRFRYTPAPAPGDHDVLGGGGMWLRLYDLKEQDALGRERLVRLGGLATIDEQRVFDRASTRLEGLRTGVNNGSQLQNYTYQWDKIGNLLQRRDANQGLTEEFVYDEQDRLLTARLNGAQTLAISYDAGGRIRTKSDVGTYAYGGARPGAVSTVSGGPAGSRTYAHDANGNMTQPRQRLLASVSPAKAH